MRDISDKIGMLYLVRISTIQIQSAISVMFRLRDYDSYKQ